MAKYQEFNRDEVTLELLNNLKVGDKIKLNDWKKPLNVRGVSVNYVIMNRRYKGDKYIYSIIEKKRSSYNRNFRQWNDLFICGPDDMVLGSPYGYAFNNQSDIDNYLKDLESCDMEVSYRNRIAIERILIKNNKGEKENDK